ncbi:dihydrolipoyllysine-residue succinyltransferase [Buchnera aphidicola]|uniref:dihydrolipoyllysine-residue succinyltransferase n=1 Tax=Buchnera aphidicola TaxID=9 RepID=UPI0034644095
MEEINILVPELPESINTATVIKWHKKIGEYIQEDEIIVDIETEKVILEVPSSINGMLITILKNEGDIVISKQILGKLKNIEKGSIKKLYQDIDNNNQKNKKIQDINNHINIHYSPSQRREIIKKDTNQDLSSNNNIKKKDISKTKSIKNNIVTTRNIKKVPMTVIRKRISERLLQTVKNTAMLTTFNEVNMQSILQIRNKYRNFFQKKYNIRLGLMSFFIKAVVEALKCFPIINAKIDDNQIIFYEYFDINIAIASDKGLLTPLLKDVNLMSMAQIEQKIQYFITAANAETITLEDLLSGNFTITNGGVFGSLLSTPIINPPQTAILGMHKIQDRVIVIDKKMTIAPMMYLSLSYDHRLIDGKEAIGFLKKIKNILEDFSRILLNI